MEPGFDGDNDDQQLPIEQNTGSHANKTPLDVVPDAHSLLDQGFNKQVGEDTNREEYLRQLVELKAKRHAMDETDKETNTFNGYSSCLATEPRNYCMDQWTMDWR
ncbi:hypothetical protein V6N13_098875 [Hibiscus sabdariffa]